MKIIGLTGGIGSGKTTVANMFRAYDIPVYIADEEARKITDDSEVSTNVIRVFGDSILDHGRIDRKKLAAIVFNDTARLAQLNAIIHPAVKKHFHEWLKEHRSHPIVIKEAAILFETGNDKDCDAVITVTAPDELRIKRVIERDNSAREDILGRMRNQWTDNQRVDNSDFVINNVNFNETQAQVAEILKKLQNL